MQEEEGYGIVGGPRAAVHIPEISLIEHGEQRMDVEEVLLDEFVENAPGRNSQAALELEIVDVLRRNVGEVADGEEGIVGVSHVRVEAQAVVGPVIAAVVVVRRPLGCRLRVE